MAYRKGQRVTLSAGSSVSLGQYESLRPMASVTIDLGDDPESDVAQARLTLRRALYESVAEALGVHNELQEFLTSNADASVEDLAKFVTGKLNDTEEEIVVSDPETSGGQGRRFRAKAGEEGSKARVKKVKVSKIRR